MTDQIKHYAMDNISEKDAQRMLENIINPKPNNKTMAIILQDAEEKDFPASMPVMRMSVVGNQIHITVCKEEDVNGAFTYTPIHQMAFDLEAFAAAFSTLISQEV